MRAGRGARDLNVLHNLLTLWRSFAPVLRQLTGDLSLRVDQTGLRQLLQRTFDVGSMIFSHTLVDASGHETLYFASCIASIAGDGQSQSSVRVLEHRLNSTSFSD